MRNYYLLSFCILLAQCVTAQRNIQGTWQGRLSVATTSLRLVVHIKEENGAYTATLDSPDQGAKGIPVNRVQLKDDSLRLEVTAAGATLAGSFTNDSTFNGQWQQGSALLPLELKKQNTETPAAELKRPQTPQPPFPYQSTDVIYYNKDKSIQYGATITKPAGNGPFPTLLLLTGSGPQNRDEELFGHKPFAVIADYLTRRGYLVLRADDRGVGQTTGDNKNATTKDFADDAIAGIEYLKTLPETDKTKLGLLGHSEGGMIAQIMAAQRTDLAFVIMLAAPGEKVIDLMTGQNRAVLLSAGMPKLTVESYLNLYKPLVQALTFSPSESSAQTAALMVVDDWLKKTPKEVALVTTGIKDEEGKEKFIAEFRKGNTTPWFRYFFRYNPDEYVSKMKGKVLVLNGDKDIQVLSKPNLAALKASLQKSRVKSFDVVELSGLNHLFQRCTQCMVNEYALLEETIAAEALETIENWLRKNVK